MQSSHIIFIQSIRSSSSTNATINMILTHLAKSSGTFSYCNRLLLARNIFSDFKSSVAFKSINSFQSSRTVQFDCIQVLYHSRRLLHVSTCYCEQSRHTKRESLSADQIRRQRYEQYQSFYRKSNKSANQDVLMYGMAIVLLALACSYAAVPIYRIYCQSTGLGGKPTQSDDYLDNKLQNMNKVKDRQITVQFNADASSQLAWNFKPTQNEIKVYPGETALAFYTAKNPLKVPVSFISI